MIHASIGMGHRGPLVIWQPETDGERKPNENEMKKLNTECKEWVQTSRDNAKIAGTLEWEHIQEFNRYIAIYNANRGPENTRRAPRQVGWECKLEMFHYSESGGVNVFGYWKLMLKPCVYVFCDELRPLYPDGNYFLIPDNAGSHGLAKDLDEHYRKKENKYY